MPYRQVVQFIPIVLPLGHEQIHHRNESRPVAGFQQMRQFMHHDVLQALGWFLGQVSVQADGAAGGEGEDADISLWQQ